MIVLCTGIQYLDREVNKMSDAVLHTRLDVDAGGRRASVVYSVRQKVYMKIHRITTVSIGLRQWRYAGGAAPFNCSHAFPQLLTAARSDVSVFVLLEPSVLIEN